MKMTKFCCMLVLIIVIGVCQCEERQKVQTRSAYGSEQQDQQEGAIVYPNDFSIVREPKPDHVHHHSHAHHMPYHGYRNGPSYGPHLHGLDDNEDDIHYGPVNSSGIPLDFAKSLNDYIVSDLLLNVIDDGPDERAKPQFIANRFGGDDANETERNAAQPARPAKCIPELTTVRIAQSNDSNIFYFPECTRIERCGGCCSHELLSCQPNETETVTFTVMKTEYTGNRRLKYIGKEPVLVERHTKCQCGCRIKEEDCNSYQEYKESECRCICKNVDEESKCYKNSSKKLWNPNVCACQCREISSCSTGLQFDHNECRCVQNQLKRRYILTDLRKEAPESMPEDKFN